MGEVAIRAVTRSKLVQAIDFLVSSNNKEFIPPKFPENYDLEGENPEFHKFLKCLEHAFTNTEHTEAHEDLAYQTLDNESYH